MQIHACVETFAGWGCKKHRKLTRFICFYLLLESSFHCLNYLHLSKKKKNLDQTRAQE